MHTSGMESGHEMLATLQCVDVHSAGPWRARSRMQELRSLARARARMA
jgi:hypothetical protein